ncbi:phosphatase PAP2 family protein [Lacticaseibacillus kribbianus]|uniref:phosphatase PAP2 family protein n=1 Tax=Lacticaseibacillus kribbianus TaxID=2926292 RepID=UPI001CD7EE39|nr:phosphatase PAP2 family protein [Lacticaseibacillus kribbianus]
MTELHHPAAARGRRPAAGQPAPLLAAAALCLFTLLALGVTAHAGWLHVLDATAARTAARAVTPLNTALFTVVAALGSPATCLIVAAAIGWWLWRRRDAAVALWFTGVQVAGLACAELVKGVTARTRPPHQLVADTGFSFPSGHTFATTLLVILILVIALPQLCDPEAQLLAVIGGLVWIGLVAASRVYLRDHFASDVLAGAALAASFGAAATAVAATLQCRLQHLMERKSRA